MNNDRRISVVVPVFNRAWYLDKFLRSLSWSRLPAEEYEVIVADDGSSDHVGMVVEVWRGRGMDVSLHPVRSPGAGRGGSIARNVGARRAKYPIVLNTDPDMVYAADVLSLVKERMEPGAFCTAGRLYGMIHETLLELCSRNDWDRLTSEDFIRATLDRPNLADSPDRCKGLHAAFACWKDSLMRIRGYDERFTEWGSEDEDLLIRLEDGLGFRRIFIEEAVVVHLWHPTQFARSIHALSLARQGQLSEMNWEIYYQGAMARQQSYPVRNSPEWGTPSPSVYRPKPFHPTIYSKFVTPHQRERFAKAWEAAASGSASTASEMMPPTYRNFFEAHFKDAQTLKRLGFMEIARKLLYYLLSRPWEGENYGWRWEGWKPPLLEDLLPQIPTIKVLYPFVPDVLSELAIIEYDLGNVALTERIQQLLESELDAPYKARVNSSLLAAREGDYEEALRYARRALEIEPGTESHALVIEFSLATGDHSGGYRTALDALGHRKKLDSFESIRLHCYLEILNKSNPDAFPVPDELAPTHERYVREVSEFVYSVAVRSIRGGFDRAGVALMRRFLDGRAPAESRLFREGEFHLASALERTGEIAEAEQRFRSIIEGGAAAGHSNHFIAAAHFHLGEMSLWRGLDKSARQEFDQCLELMPAHRKARQYLTDLGQKSGM